MAFGKTLEMQKIQGGTARSYLLPGERFSGLSMTERKRRTWFMKRVKHAKRMVEKEKERRGDS